MALDPSDLVGAAEIGERLDVDRRTVSLWRKRGLGFPEPVAELKQALVWSWAEVERWAKETGRL